MLPASMDENSQERGEQGGVRTPKGCLGLFGMLSEFQHLGC